MLLVNPKHMCVDGSRTRAVRRQLDPYQQQIRELIEQGFEPSQILRKLRNTYPTVDFKRTTLNDFCIRLKAELYEYTERQTDDSPELSHDSILFQHADKIKNMFTSGKPLTEILSTIKADGYNGSYSLLQQYCFVIKPIAVRSRKTAHKIKRKDLTSFVWSGGGTIESVDIDYINDNYPDFGEIKTIIDSFRTAYSGKDADSVKEWCEKYCQCRFPAICSFIKGIANDKDAFYNSMKYEFSNGLLEGSVNKLKTVKRSMYGRASYLLLRAKLLLANIVDL
jgi:hypothetical protein